MRSPLGLVLICASTIASTFGQQAAAQSALRQDSLSFAIPAAASLLALMGSDSSACLAGSRSSVAARSDPSSAPTRATCIIGYVDPATRASGLQQNVSLRGPMLVGAIKSSRRVCASVATIGASC